MEDRTNQNKLINNINGTSTINHLFYLFDPKTPYWLNIKINETIGNDKKLHCLQAEVYTIVSEVLNEE